MNQFPIFIKIKGHKCLIAGEENKAYFKIKLLIKAGANVELFSKNPSKEIKELKHRFKIINFKNKIQDIDLTNYRLVIGASEDQEINKYLSEESKNLNIPVNVVDRPDWCTFTIPSIVDRSPLLVAISSNEISPTLSKYIKRKIEALLPSSYGPLAEMIGKYRRMVLEKSGSYKEKKRFWEKLFSGPFVNLFLSGEKDKATKILKNELNISDNNQIKGRVILAGAGPGDPELITLRTLRFLQTADVIVYDRLVSNSILDFANSDAEMIYAGKKEKNHFLDQKQINKILIKLANDGKNVLRLKGGDPFIFGRGGEELEALFEAGLDFEVIPGITAAIGCCAYAGIPLTHRDHAQSCVFVTAHGKENLLKLNWKNLTQPRQTVVFYMGSANAHLISKKLIKYGKSKNTPTAIIQNGTTKNQKIIVGVIADLKKNIETITVGHPCIIVIGETVKLHHNFMK